MQNKYLVTDRTQETVRHVVEKVAEAVTATMGPNGTLSLIENGMSFKVTKDGVTVAKNIKFEDPHEEIISRVLIEPAIKTDDECGDGTTTTIFLTSLLYTLFSSFSDYREQKFIVEFFNNVIKRLEERSIKIDLGSDLIYKLALTSSNNDEELSKIVTEIYNDSKGKFPIVELKESIGVDDVVERSDGIPIPMNFSSPLYSDNMLGSKTDYKDFIPYVLDGPISNFSEKQFLELTSAIDRSAGKEIIIICRSCSNEVNNMFKGINTHIANGGGLKRTFTVLQTNAGGSVGSLLMGDIAAIFGVALLADFGSIKDTKQVICTDTLVAGSKDSVITVTSQEIQDRINTRINEIKSDQISKEAKDKHSIRGRFNEKRVRMLSGELVTVYVGGETNAEIKERKDRFEDVIKAVKSALINGILPGVGTSFADATQDVRSYYFDKNLSEIEELIVRSIMDNIELAQTKKILSVIDTTPDGKIIVTNLATGERGTPEQLGIYDTAYASITALKGGLQTAKILANLRSLIIGSKGAAVSV